MPSAYNLSFSFPFLSLSHSVFLPRSSCLFFNSMFWQDLIHTVRAVLYVYCALLLMNVCQAFIKHAQCQLSVKAEGRIKRVSMACCGKSPGKSFNLLSLSGLNATVSNFRMSKLTFVIWVQYLKKILRSKPLSRSSEVSYRRFQLQENITHMKAHRKCQRA